MADESRVPPVRGEFPPANASIGRVEANCAGGLLSACGIPRRGIWAPASTRGGAVARRKGALVAAGASLSASRDASRAAVECDEPQRNATPAMVPKTAGLAKIRSNQRVIVPERIVGINRLLGYPTIIRGFRRSRKLHRWFREMLIAAVCIRKCPSGRPDVPPLRVRPRAIFINHMVKSYG